MIKIGNIYEGELRMNSSGSAYLVSDELEKDIYIHKKNTGKRLHLDIVEIEIISGKDGKLEGKVIEVIERFKTTFVGKLQVTDKFAFLIPDSPKMHTDLYIPLSKLNGGINGQKAIAKLTSWGETAKNPNGKIIEVLGDAGNNDVEIHSILHEYGLPYNFEEEVESEANKISLDIPKKEIDKRKDMRDVLTFTIDPDTAKDFDDALSFEKVGDNFRVGIHIADVSHYVRPGTELDKEAYNRGTSVYLVDRVVPMLPERLSNGVCSLRPHEEKLCFSAVFTLNTEGDIINEWFGRTVIYSDHRYTYEEAQEIIESESENDSDEKVIAIKTLDRLAKKMRAKRYSVTFDSPEVKFKLDEDGKPTDIMFKVSKDSNKLIEEFMLLANRRVAHFLNKKQVAIPNRIHADPDPVKLESLKSFIKQFGYEIDLSTSDTVKDSLNKLVLDVRGSSEENIINNLVVRTMQKAQYSTDNIGHYGLGFEDYAHFTSPIRRYPDVMLHRILDKVLNNKISKGESKIEPKCEYLSKREVVAQKASRDSIKFKQAEFMSDKIGKVYRGVVTSVLNYGLFVEIKETMCEGLVRISEINGDTFTYDEKNYCIKGYNTGEVIRLGDEVTIIVKSVDVEKKNIDLSLIKL
jgi:ribonuclease R